MRSESTMMTLMMMPPIRRLCLNQQGYGSLVLTCFVECWITMVFVWQTWGIWLLLNHISIKHYQDHSLVGGTLRGRVTHTCVGNLTIIGSDNGLSPGRRQAIIRTNAGILLFGPLGTNWSEIVIKIETFSFKKMHFKMSSRKWRSSCFGLQACLTSSHE